MSDPLQILRDGGLPLATPASGERRSPRELAGALRAAIESQPKGREADAIAAYALAWQQHWPTSFRAELGDRAADTVAWARAHALDADRYLKLRRIALENLSRVL